MFLSLFIFSLVILLIFKVLFTFFKLQNDLSRNSPILLQNRVGNKKKSTQFFLQMHTLVTLLIVLLNVLNFVLYLNRFKVEGRSDYLHHYAEGESFRITCSNGFLRNLPPNLCMYPCYSTIQGISRLLNNH